MFYFELLRYWSTFTLTNYVEAKKVIKMKKNILLLFLAFMTLGVYAQEAAETVQPEEPKPLFKYPQAPDTITSFQDRANYVIARFW